MKKFSSIKLLVVLLSVFLLINVASQIYKTVYNPYKYETVITYTTKDSIEFKGLFIRQENIITYNGGKDVVTYNFDNGTKVFKNAPIISVFENQEDAARQLKIEQIEARINALDQSQSADATDTSKLDNVNIALDNESAKLVKNISLGDYSTAEKTKTSLIDYLNRMSIIKGKCANFSELIYSLRDDISTLKGQMTSSPEYIYSKESGYFMSECDGYEYLNFDNVSELTVDKVNAIMKGEEKHYSADSVGKILDNYYFKIAGIFDYNDVAMLVPGDIVNLQIELNRTLIEATIDSVTADEDGKAVVVMTCDEVTDDYFQHRISDIQLVKATYNGIRVPKGAVRFYENQRGVFVKSGTVIVFKTIDVIYENNEFVICDLSSEKTQLAVYDEIVTKGNDMYDGKSIG